MTTPATLAGAPSMLANVAMFSRMFGGSSDRNNPLGGIGILLMAILAPLAATLVQLAISRAREYDADALGAQLCGRPLWLASAPERLDGAARPIANTTPEANPAPPTLFIVTPPPPHPPYPY